MASKKNIVADVRQNIRDGFDTRRKGKGWNDVSSIDKEDANNSKNQTEVCMKVLGYRELKEGNDYWERIQMENEKLRQEKEKQKEIERNKSLRYTMENYPALGPPANTIAPKPVVSYTKVVKRDRVEEEAIKNRKLKMLSQPKVKVIVPVKKNAYISTEEEEEERAEWEAFEYNEDIGIVGREFDI